MSSGPSPLSGRPKRGKTKTGRAGVGSRQLDQVPASSYTDAEEALDAGIQLEEKAERFAVGEKARKYYVLSLDVYRRCMQLEQANADAAYNAARVLFVLATAFSLPPDSVNALQEGVGMYKHAFSLTSAAASHEDGLPNAFHLDVQFNLGMAFLALAEQIDRCVPPSDQRALAPAAFVEEAIRCFEAVYAGQEAVLQHQKVQEEESAAADVERPPLIPGAADGHSGRVEDGEVDDEADEEMTSEDGSSDKGAPLRAEYTSSLITPASALETIASLHAASVSLMDMTESQAKRSEIARTCLVYHAKAEQIFAMYPDGERRSPDNEWNEQVAALRYASLELKSNAIQQNDDSTENLNEIGVRALSEATVLLESANSTSFEITTSSGRAMQKFHLQHLEQVGGLLLDLARVNLGTIYASLQNVDQNAQVKQVQQAWQLCTQSSKLFLAASKALDSSVRGQGSVTVLGSAHTLNPSARRRSALFTSLSAVSVLRSDDVFITFGFVPGVDEKTRRTLLDNAPVYARKAVAEVGMAWLLQESNANLHHRQSTLASGLDSFVVDVEAIVALLRILSIRATYPDPEISAAAKAETVTLCTNLTRKMASENKQVWWTCLGIPSREQGVSLGQGLLEQAIGSEGEGAVSAEQRQFWADVESVLLAE